MKTAFVTDSGTGKTVEELAKEGIFSVPLQVSYDNTNYQDLEELSIDRIYELMRDGVMLSTSLPSLGKIEALFEHLKNDGYEQIFAVPICSGLSGTINAMEMCARTVGLAFAYVDCHVTAVVQEYMIKTAKRLHEEGKTIQEIKDLLLPIYETNENLETIYDCFIEITTNQTQLKPLIDNLINTNQLDINDKNEKLIAILVLANLANQIINVIEGIIDNDSKNI